MEENVKQPDITTTPTPEVVPTKKGGKTPLIILLVLLLVVATGLAGYFYARSSMSQPAKTPDAAKAIEVTPTLTPENAITPTTAPSATTDLQSLITSKCSQLQKDRAKQIAVSDLPVTFDTTFVPLKDNLLDCLWGTPGKNYLLSRADGKNSIAIYDKNSEELGHGGASYFGFVGREIYNKDGVRLGLHFSWSEVGLFSEPYVQPNIRAEKTFKTTTNPFYVSINYDMSEIADDKYKALLKPFFEYSNEDKSYKLKKTVKIEDIENAVIKEYFSDMNNLTPPVKSPVEKIFNFLKTVQISS